MTKNEARIKGRKILGDVSNADRERQSHALCRQVALQRFWTGGSLFLLFTPVPAEPDITPLALELINRGISPAVPVPVGETMVFRRVTGWRDATWAPGPFGIPIPPPEAPEIKGAELVRRPWPVILVPGLLFTAAGARLGRGGGYYDRWLERWGSSCLKIGVCFREQLVTALPEEPHDGRMDLLAAPDGLIDCSGRFSAELTSVVNPDTINM